MNLQKILSEDIKVSFANLIKTLGFSNNNNFFFLHKREDRLKGFPVRLHSALIDKLKIDAVYTFNNKPVVLFKTFEKNEENELRDFHRAIWNLNEAPIAFAILPFEIRIYNAFVFQDKEKLFKIISRSSTINDFYYLSNFSSFDIDSGRIWEVIGDKLKNESRVDEKLLRNLKAARTILKKEGLDYRVIHSLLGRCIFSRYLIDRGAIPKGFFLNNYSAASFHDLILDKNKLYNKFFHWLGKRFNGDMFPITEEEKDSIGQKHLNIVHRLFKGDELINGQISLFDRYDFSIIPVELISNIYEDFLTQEIPDDKKRSGTFYTPLVLVDFILNNTLDPILKKKNDHNVSILDPACGSGVFLVESFRRIVEKYLIKNEKNKISKKSLKAIVLNNIYGIDKSLDAVRIAVFSLYIAMLDYVEPKDIAINGFQFPYLVFNKDKKDREYGRNFFIADFFDRQGIFQKEAPFRDKRFDLIIGNPPWGTPKGKEHLYEKYCKEQIPPVPISDRQIAQAFLVRAKDFSQKDTEVALIVTSKILYNLKAKDFRNYFLTNFLISNVLEFSPVRRLMFKNAIGPGAIVFYKKAEMKVIEHNEITYYALKPNLFSEKLRIIAAEGSEVKTISQKHLIEHDYLWKIMLYGNVLDFYFLKRLKSEYIKLEAFLDENKMAIGRGLEFPTSDGKTKDYPDLKDYKIIYADDRQSGKNLLHKYYIDYKNAEKIPTTTLRDPGIIEVYKAPHILIRREIQNDGFIKLAFTNQDCVFTKSVISIAAKNKKDISLLKYLIGLFISKLAIYYLFHTSPQWGVERGDLYINVLREIPINFIGSNRDIQNIISTVEQIEQLAKERCKNTVHTLTRNNIDHTIKNLEDKINRLVYKIFDIGDIERDLLDYTYKISIPFFNNKKDPLTPPNNAQLKDYAQIFVDIFINIFKQQEKSFQAEIYANGAYFIAMNFRVLDEKHGDHIVFKQDSDIDSVIRRFGFSSFVNISQDLYVQRALTGFERDSFYIIKPNEKKNWHRANARHDVNQFIEAMLENDIRRIVGKIKTQ